MGETICKRHDQQKMNLQNLQTTHVAWSFPGGSDSKASVCNAGDLGSILGLGRSSGEGNGNPLQYSYLENPMDRGASWATDHGIARVRHDLGTKPPPPSCN